MKHYRAVIVRGSIAAFVVLGVLLASACGSPRDGDEPFTFDPQPYITWESGTPIAADFATCGLYPADQLLVDVENQHVPGFVTWVGEIGFRISIQQELVAGNRTMFLLIVPVGSVPDAARVVRKRTGVIDAYPNHLTFIGPDPTPHPSLACRPNAKGPRLTTRPLTNSAQRLTG